MPTALSILTGRSFNEIIKAFGHDGSELGFKSHHFEGRRCFNDAELVVAAYKLNVHLVPFIKEVNSPDHQYSIDSPTFKRILERRSGILLGNWRRHGGGHSVCWSHGERMVFDPANGQMYSIEQSDDRLNVEVFYAWVNTRKRQIY